MTCTNNLKQIGLAIHNRNDTYGELPTGGGHWQLAPTYSSVGNPMPPRDQHSAGWLFQILPFIEQDAVWKGAGGVTIADCQRNAIAAPIKAYFCPSRGKPRVFTQATNWYNPANAGTHAQTDYAASIGPNSQTNGFLQKTWSDDGNTRQREPINLNMITSADGLSNTSFCRRQTLTDQSPRRIPGEDNEGYTSGWDHDVWRRTDLLPLADCNTAVTSGCADSHRFGSSHPGGFNGLLGDGSVRFLRYTIDATTFRNLGDRIDGQVISNF